MMTTNVYEIKTKDTTHQADDNQCLWNKNKKLQLIKLLMLLSYDSLVYLKGCWDYYVSQNEREYILIVKKILVIIKKNVYSNLWRDL